MTSQFDLTWFYDVIIRNSVFQLGNSRSHCHSYDQRFFRFFFKLGFTPCEAEQLLQGMELQENETQKDYSIQESC